jgi:Family of unknown function (DUF6152)
MKALRPMLLAAAILSVSPAIAHHSAATFDQGALVILKGVLRSFSYVNPHSWISIEGSPAGTADATRWDIEATSPSTLAGIGLTAQTLNTGDRVTVGIRPLRDGRHGGSMVFVIGPDGKTYGASPEALGLRVEELKP